MDTAASLTGGTDCSGESPARGEAPASAAAAAKSFLGKHTPPNLRFLLLVRRGGDPDGTGARRGGGTSLRQRRQWGSRGRAAGWSSGPRRWRRSSRSARKTTSRWWWRLRGTRLEALAGSTPAAEANRRARAASLCGGNRGGGGRRRRLIAVVPLEIEQKAYGLKGIGLAFGREEDEVPEKKPRVLAQSNAANLNNKGGYSARPSSADPNRMSERRVRRGSDPIHNRC
uniref:Uncharacterized protein n=1 Tax=Oryza meridionalis TaxID=40149 RepID=A0A0E0ELY9_9ORYZ